MNAGSDGQNPPPDPTDDRAPFAKAIGKAQMVIGVALGMVLPMLLGLGLDYGLGTVVVFTALGAAAGMAFGIWRLLQIANSGRS